jgi:RimJ/RimL family protein N-acetyltransferase
MIMRRFDVVTTDRLVMRRWRETDREPFAELNGDPETLAFFPGPITPPGGCCGTL